MIQNGRVQEGDVETPPKCLFKQMEITNTKIACCIFAICSYVLDVGFDVYVAVKHYKNGSEVYFILTLIFIILPAVIITATSLKWYINAESTDYLKASPTQWIIRIILLTFLMAPVLRSVEALYYANRSSKCRSRVDKENYARRMIFESTDASLLRLFEAFLECAPQLILQIYIIAQVYYIQPDISTTVIIQLISLFTSLVSMTNAIVSYFRNLRESLDYKNELSCSISIFPFLWRFFEITARVLTLGLFASILLPYFFLVCGIHFGGMLLWIRFMNTNFCDNKFEEFVFNVVLSFISIFCFINPKDDNTRIRCTVYYFIIFGENTVLISIWYHHCLLGASLPILIVVFVCFALACIIMVLYYILFHPTRGTLFGKPCPVDRNIGSQSVADQFNLSNELIGITGRETEMQEAVPCTIVQNENPTNISTEYEQRTECSQL